MTRANAQRCLLCASEAVARTPRSDLDLRSRRAKEIVGKAKGESRGLAFLKEARPAAVEHLLKFFGESARHLDSKTRFLISVVTKVISGSPRGLLQYAKRARQEGASEEEILDAVLCAYPCAGLTKVVDAVDVLLDGGFLEGVALGAERSASGDESETGALATGSPVPGSAVPGVREAHWVRVAALDEIPPGGSLRVEVETAHLALFNVDGTLHAIDNVCPHKGGFLAQGPLNGTVVSCPLHAWSFELTTGECVQQPGRRVRTYPVRVQNAAEVEVCLP